MNVPGINVRQPPPPLPPLPAHLQQEVFTHSSNTSPTCPNSYERLEFRGIAVLNTFITRILLALPRRLDIRQLAEIRNKFIATEKIEKWGMMYYPERICVARHMWPTSDRMQPGYAKDLFYAYIGALDVLSERSESEDIMGGFVGQLVVPELNDILLGFHYTWDKDSCRILNERLIQGGVKVAIR